MRPIATLVFLVMLVVHPGALAGHANDPFQPDRPTLTRRGSAGFVPGGSTGGAQGVAVSEVLPGSAAERAGLKARDIITAIDQQPTPDQATLTQALAGTLADQTLDFDILRNGEPSTIQVTLAPRALQLPGTTTTYGEALTANGYAVRTILTVPDDADGPLPAVFFIQGIPCSSVDATSIADRGLLKCIQDIAQAGFITLLIDKPGVGDSAGPDCAEYGFHEEMQAFRAALQQLKQHPAVNPEQVFLVGISLGGIQAPLLASEFMDDGAPGVAGVAVFGTGYIPWTEYMVGNVRRQAGLMGASVEQINAIADAYAKFWSLLLYARLPSTEILERDPDLAQYGFPAEGPVAAGRSAQFFTEMHDSNWSLAWSVLEMPVLAMHGSFDFVCNRQDHEWIVEAVNNNSPGSAEFVVLDRMCHGMTTWESERQALMNGLGTGEPSDAATEALLAFFARAMAGGE